MNPSNQSNQSIDPIYAGYPITNKAVQNCTGGPDQSYTATLNEVQADWNGA